MDAVYWALTHKNEDQKMKHYRLVKSLFCILIMLPAISMASSSTWIINHVKNMAGHDDYIDIFVKGKEPPVANVDMEAQKKYSKQKLGSGTVKAISLATCIKDVKCTEYTEIENLPASCLVDLKAVDSFIINGSVSEERGRYFIKELSCSSHFRYTESK